MEGKVVTVKGIPRDIDLEELKNFMGRVGEVNSFRFNGDPSVGLCEYVSAEIAEKAVTDLKDEVFKGISLSLSIQSPSSEMSRQDMIKALKLAGYTVQKDDNLSLSSEGSAPPAANPWDHYHPTPRISVFAGETNNKLSVENFEMWEYEISCLLQQEVHSKEVIENAVRNSLRGQAARVVRHLGPNSSIEEIVEKLEGIYGTVESGADLLAQAYNTHQQKGETTAAFGCRLESLVMKAKDRGGISAEEVDRTLRVVFWKGLVDDDVRGAVRHNYQEARNFGDLLRLTRLAEQECADRRHLKRNAQTGRVLMHSAAPSPVVPDLEVKVRELTKKLEELQRADRQESDYQPQNPVGQMIYPLDEQGAPKMF
ncbi:hypothetical protein BSL78_09552 [Apostichopus japonicus]|uniref:RRM domain-containing protein n=1 Tax=Stichopus japonicus TaxID=307972 RepID=A0A2G8KZW7_STIJA|nr:hypothetical protein BSL78_09552 [Apostichopus japonicus]